MEITQPVHKPKRIPRGVRLEADVWDFIDGVAKATGEEGAAQVVTRWAREKMDRVREAA